MKVYRLVEVEIPNNLEGICWNESIKGKIVWKQADSRMCSVGIIRRGRNWGDYNGKYCAECPYFLAPGLIHDFERDLLECLAKEVNMSANKLLEMLTDRAQNSNYAPRMRSSYGGHGSAEYDERTTCHTKFFTLLTSARKLLKTTFQVLKLANKSTADKLMIMKTAYLIQREYFKVHGKRFVNLPFFRYFYGPYNQLILIALDEFAQQGLIEQTDDLEYEFENLSVKIHCHPKFWIRLLGF